MSTNRKMCFGTEDRFIYILNHWTDYDDHVPNTIPAAAARIVSLRGILALHGGMLSVFLIIPITVAGGMLS